MWGRVRGLFVQGRETVGNNFVYEPLPGDAAVGSVSMVQAQALPGVGRGVDLIAGVLSQLTFQALEQTQTRVVTVPRVPTPPLLFDPDPDGDLPGPSWFSAAAAQLMWHGNCFAHKTFGEPRNWAYPDHPSRLTMLDATGMVWDPDKRMFEFGTQTLDPTETFHAKVGSHPGRRLGEGILGTHQDALKIIRATEKAQFVVMRHGVPTGIISMTDPNATQADANAYKQAFLKSQEERSVAVMSHATFQQTNWDPTQMAMIPAREFHLRLASDMTGVPPYMLGVPSESRVYTNAETEWTNFIRTSLGRILAPLEFALGLCLPRSLVVKADLGELTRAESKTRWEIYALQMGLGATTVPEIRDRERMGPITGGGGSGTV